MNDDVAAEPVWIEPQPQGGSRLIRVVLLVAVCLVLLAAIVVGVWLAKTKLPTEQAAYDRLAAILQEHRQLRSRGASDAEWEAFATRTKPEVDAIVRQLDYGGARYPVAQQMLWASRDYLMPMIADSREMPSRNEEKFTEHLENARRMLHGERI